MHTSRRGRDPLRPAKMSSRRRGSKGSEGGGGCSSSMIVTVQKGSGGCSSGLNSSPLSCRVPLLAHEFTGRRLHCCCCCCCCCFLVADYRIEIFNKVIIFLFSFSCFYYIQTLKQHYRTHDTDLCGNVSDNSEK